MSNCCYSVAHLQNHHHLETKTFFLPKLSFWLFLSHLSQRVFECVYTNTQFHSTGSRYISSCISILYFATKQEYVWFARKKWLSSHVFFLYKVGNVYFYLHFVELSFFNNQAVLFAFTKPQNPIPMVFVAVASLVHVWFLVLCTRSDFSFIPTCYQTRQLRIALTFVLNGQQGSQCEWQFVLAHSGKVALSPVCILTPSHLSVAPAVVHQNWEILHRGTSDRRSQA